MDRFTKGNAIKMDSGKDGEYITAMVIRLVRQKSDLERMVPSKENGFFALDQKERSG